MREKTDSSAARLEWMSEIIAVFTYGTFVRTKHYNMLVDGRLNLPPRSRVGDGQERMWTAVPVSAVHLFKAGLMPIQTTGDER